MERIWVKLYDKDIPEEINPETFPSLVELFCTSCDQFRDLPALKSYGTELSYGQLDEYSRNFAAYCQKVLGLEKGDRLAIMMPNTLQYLITLYGALRAGLTVVNVNPLYTKDELVRLSNDSGSKAIVVIANFAATVQEALPEVTTLQHVIVTEIGDLFPWPKRIFYNWVVKRIKKMVPAWSIPTSIRYRDVLTEGQRLALQAVSLASDDIAFLQYTGGTTGTPKAAVLTHRNMLANIEQTHAWVKHVLEPGKEVIITALPLYHIFSLTANALLFLKLGAKNILITNPRDISAFVKEMQANPFTVLTGVNTLFNALLHSKPFRGLNFSGLKLTLGGGMAVQQEIASRWQKVTKGVITQAYGLTETSPAVCINPLSLHAFNGSIGLPLPSTEVSIRTHEGQEVPIGESGELCVHGPQVMREYWQRPEETAQVFWEGHWLRTGDIAKFDDRGFVYIVDRLKDMIIVSGFKVYPNEIEDVIVSMDGVLEAGVVGLKNEKGREIVTAFVVKTKPELSQNEILDYCRLHLTNYKIPKAVHFVDNSPKSNVCKVLR